VETPNLCGTGACGSCAAKLLSGSIERSDILLDEAQRDAGYLLLCSAHATSDIEVLMQQETQMHTLPYGL
jgi:ferredoxin